MKQSWICSTCNASVNPELKICPICMYITQAKPTIQNYPNQSPIVNCETETGHFEQSVTNWLK